MLFSVAVNFTGGILIEKYQTRKKKILVATLIINLGLLGYFKYFGTLTEAITGLFSADGTGTTLFQVALPIGISFYTFQALSYVINVYRGEVPAQHNFWHMLLYISFPLLTITIHIVKYRDIAAQITGRKETIRKFAAGIMRFCWGLGKKVLLANSFARVVDEIFKYGPYAVSRKALWLGAILYMMQIYYDFSGYSDMAIGLAAMAGFHFEENFRRPYSSTSIREFWRRWHISLSSWLRDYLYIPLGGSKRGELATYKNLLIVFFLCGLWHGADVTFILWGLWHGLFLVFERLPLGRMLERLPNVFSRVYTLFVILVGWVFFRADNIDAAGAYLKNMFTISFTPVTLSYYTTACFALAVGIVSSLLPDRFFPTPTSHSAESFPASAYWLQALLAVLSVVLLLSGTRNPFIYFDF